VNCGGDTGAGYPLTNELCPDMAHRWILFSGDVIISCRKRFALRLARIILGAWNLNEHLYTEFFKLTA